MDLRKLGFLTLILAFGLTGGCTMTDNAAAAAEVQPDGKADGTLTINGKAFPLKYVYTGSKPSSTSAGGGVEILIANEPVSYETLSRIFLEFGAPSYLRKASAALKGTSLKVLYLTPYLTAGGAATTTEARCESAVLITSEAFFDYDGQGDSPVRLEDVKFINGTLSARSKYDWEQTEIGEDHEDVKIKASYSVSFSAPIREDSLFARSFSSENKSWQRELPGLPQAGKAQGNAKLKDHSIKLAYSYAMRRKTDKFGQVVTVLLTDEPVPKEFLLFAIERSVPLDISGLYLQLDESGKVRECILRHSHGQQPFDQSQLRSFNIANGKITGSADGQYKSNFPGDSASYSVSFDAPLKN